MLDQAMQYVLGSELDSPESYAEAQLIKPHGSVNWFIQRRPTDPVIDTSREIGVDYAARYRLATGLMFSRTPSSRLDDICVIPPGHEAMLGTGRVFHWMGNSYFYPLLMLPLLTKTASPLTTWLPVQPINWSHTLLSRADDIYVVGYRARDDIFRDMIVSVKDGARLHVVGRGGAGEVAGRVTALSSRLRDGSIHDAGFAAYVDAGSP
jgi:hypothetical protein